MIAEGFVPPPSGTTANADYGEEHVAAIRRYQYLHGLGYPPAAIKLLLQSQGHDRAEVKQLFRQLQRIRVAKAGT